jgi:hypothetical protein
MTLLYFHYSLSVDNTYGTQNPLISSSSQRFSTQSSAVGSQLSPEDQFIQGHRILKLSDITKLNQVQIHITIFIFVGFLLYAFTTDVFILLLRYSG